MIYWSWSLVEYHLHLLKLACHQHLISCTLHMEQKGSSHCELSQQKYQLKGQEQHHVSFLPRVTFSLPQPCERPPAAQLRVAARGLRAPAVRPVQWSTITYNVMAQRGKKCFLSGDHQGRPLPSQCHAHGGHAGASLLLRH